MRSPSRRRVLVGALGLAAAAAAGGYELVESGTLPGKYALAQLTGGCGAPPPGPSGPAPVRQVVTFRSEYRRRAVQMVTLIPAGLASSRGLAVVIALHGTGGSAASMARQIAPAMTSARAAGFAAICVDGGDTYWHGRADGDDPVGMILHEVLPRAASAGMRVGRIGITGESMGGYGALLLAARLSAGGTGAAPASSAVAATVSAAGAGQSPAGAGQSPAGAGQSPVAAAVGALSPAIFGSYADARAANRGAFDGPADFARNDVFRIVQRLREMPVWIACGQDDPFQPAAAQLRQQLASVTGHQVPGGILAGCHDDAFWERNLPAALQFIAAELD